MYDFDTMIDRKGTNCHKWENMRPFGGKEVLPFWIADMDLAVPPGVIEALNKRTAHPIYGYTMPQDSLFQSIADWNQKRHGWLIEREWMLIANGVVPSISAAILALTEPGDQVIIQPPVYPPFAACITKNKRQIVENPLKVLNGRYVPDFDDLEKKITSKTKCLILCNPHNPVGRVWTREELTRLNEICLRHEVVIISDEIHCDLVFKGHKHTPSASLSEASAQNTITLIAASKTFNLAGTATSFVIIPDHVKRQNFIEITEALACTKGGNLFGFTATEAAYQTGEKWLDALLTYLEGNAEYLVDYVTQYIPGVKITKPEGTFLGWLDFRQVTDDPATLNNLLIDRARVGLNNGSSFGSVGAGFARINFACPRTLLHEGLTRIETAVKQF